MTLEELLLTDLHNKDVLIIGRPGSGKTWLSNVLEGMYKYHKIIHCDGYLKVHPNTEGQIEAIIEDVGNDNPCIVEGMLAYQLLLEGAKRKCYIPDIVIEVVISRGQQRKIYLAERTPEKIRTLEWSHMRNISILNQYHQSVLESDKPLWLKLENNYAVKDPY